MTDERQALEASLEALKFDPSASHIAPEERDTYNRAIDDAIKLLSARSAAPSEPDAWVAPAPVFFEFDKKKPKPDRYAAYTVMQLHEAYRDGVEIGKLSAIAAPVVAPSEPVAWGWLDKRSGCWQLTHRKPSSEVDGVPLVPLYAATLQIAAPAPPTEPICLAHVQERFPGDLSAVWCARCGEGVVPGLCRARALAAVPPTQDQG